jgi:hypothetical protein
MAGLAGNLRLGKVAGPVGGADMGIAEVVKGLGGTIGAVAGGEDFLTPVSVGDEAECSSLQEYSDGTLIAVSGSDADSGVVSPEPSTRGELRDMALDRKSV